MRVNGHRILANRDRIVRNPGDGLNRYQRELPAEPEQAASGNSEPGDLEIGIEVEFLNRAERSAEFVDGSLSADIFSR
ncbi:MAG: hypothetical protein U0556_11510 [Dehalococcoidia bacterium]